MLNNTSQNGCHTILDSSSAEYEIHDEYNSDLILGISADDYWSPKSHVITLPDQVIFNFFCSRQQVQTLPSLRVDRVNVVLNSVKPHRIERHEGDLRNRVEKLLSPIDQESFLECLSFFVIFFSNGSHVNEYEDPRRFTEIIEHVVYQPKHALRKILSLGDPSLLAFMHSILQVAERTSNFAAGRALLEADEDRILFRGRPDHLLYTATKFQHLDLLQELIRNGANVNALTGSKEKPKPILSVATTVECFESLKRAGARINEPTWIESISGAGQIVTPIHSAIIRNHAELVQCFLEAGADVTWLNENLNREFFVLGGVIGSDNGFLMSLLLDAGAVFPDNILWHEWHPVSHMMLFPTVLHLAVFYGSSNVVRALLQSERYSDILRTGQYRWALLRDAANNGDSSMVEILIAAGADVNRPNEKFLLKHTRPWDGVDFGLAATDRNKTVYYGVELLPCTPLMAAVESGHAGMVQLLIDHHVNINVEAFGYHGSSAYESSQVLGHEDISRILVQHGASMPPLQFNENRGRELVSAVERRDLGRARQLIEIGTGLTSIITYLALLDLRTRYITKSIPFKDIDYMLSFFLGCGGDVNFQEPSSGKSLLEIAFCLLDFNAARNLIIKGADARADRGRDRISLFDYALGQLGFFGKLMWTFSQRSQNSPEDKLEVGFEVMHMMMDMGASIISKKSLYVAGYLKDLDLVQRIVQARSRAGNLNREELHWGLVSASFNSVLDRRIAEYLISIGANVNRPPGYLKSYRTPLQAASSVGNVELVEKLLGMGADINARAPPEEEFATALQEAAAGGESGVVSVLLENGADANAEGLNRGGTRFGNALMLACSRGYLEIARMLLDYGADVNAEYWHATFKWFKNVLGLSAYSGKLDTVQLLLNAGADSYEYAIECALEEENFVIADLIKDWMEEKKREASMVN